jgi:serine protease Do
LKSSGRQRQAVTFSMLLASVVFGMVLAGALDLGPQGHAQTAPSAGSVQAPSPMGGAGLPSFADLAERVLPSVVSIEADTIEKAGPGQRRGGPVDPFEFFFNNPHGQGPGGGGPGGQGQDGQPEEYRSSAGGSGFVVSSDGYIVTNNHVIEGATKIRVHLEDREYEAQLKGADPATDLALLKIDAGHGLTPLPLGDSDALRVGDWVMAIGNPLLLEHTVTVGVVSAKGRSIGLTQDVSFENFIQTDAAINRGNSGGPLVNIRGEVVGIATAMNWGAENIGFAVPVNTLKGVLPQLKESGKVSRGYLGVNIQNLDWERAQAFGLSTTDGALVTTVIPGSPADSAGLQHGDVVVGVDGKPVKQTRDLIDYVSSKKPGSNVKLDVLRNGKRMTLTALLTERQEATEAATNGGEHGTGGIDWLGLDYQDLTPQIRQSLGIPDGIEGIVVRQLSAESPLVDEGVAPGDVITEVNGVNVKSGTDFQKQVKGAKSGDYLRFYLTRYAPQGQSQGVSYFAIVHVP